MNALSHVCFSCLCFVISFTLVVHACIVLFGVVVAFAACVLLPDFHIVYENIKFIAWLIISTLNIISVLCVFVYTYTSISFFIYSSLFLFLTMCVFVLLLYIFNLNRMYSLLSLIFDCHRHIFIWLRCIFLVTLPSHTTTFGI